MNISDNRIDGGKAFDWGRVSADYARYRDIYPPEFYEKIVRRGLCVQGQRALDIGTGTGVLPRHMARYGAQWVGADISENQIAEARALSAGTDIRYVVSPAESLDFPANSFDVITACQCFWYFRHEQCLPLFRRILKPGGRMLLLYMAWLPFDDPIAGASEKLILRYSPAWSGAGETIRPIAIPPVYLNDFSVVYHEEYPLQIPFTRESWHGRVKACRAIGASLSPAALQAWEQEHQQLLASVAPERFTIAHYAAIAELQLRS